VVEEPLSFSDFGAVAARRNPRC